MGRDGMGEVDGWFSYTYICILALALVREGGLWDGYVGVWCLLLLSLSLSLARKAITCSGRYVGG
jgi:hypothetical protein